MTFEHTIGTRAQVWHGTSQKTSGGLTKSDLMMNKHGRIVSRKKHNTAKREKRLVKAGYLTKKGHFGFVKTGKGSKKMRGGTGSPTGTGLQGTPAGNAMAGKAMPMHKATPHMISKGMKGGTGMAKHPAAPTHAAAPHHAAAHMNKAMKGGMNHPSPHHAAAHMNKAMKGGMNHPSPHAAAHHAPAQHKGGRGHSMKMRGGMYALSPSSYDGKGVGTSGAGLQIMATQMS